MKGLGLWNIAVLVMFALDKHQAKKHRRRISEKVLLISTAALGGAGALLGMYIFHHKTHKMRFVITAVISAIITILISIIPLFT